jgi:hypothetical protein
LHVRLEKVLNHQALLIEAEGALMCIPFHNVKYLQVYPAPAKLPDHVIKAATLID